MMAIRSSTELPARLSLSMRLCRCARRRAASARAPTAARARAIRRRRRSAHRHWRVKSDAADFPACADRARRRAPLAQSSASRPLAGRHRGSSRCAQRGRGRVEIGSSAGERCGQSRLQRRVHAVEWHAGERRRRVERGGKIAASAAGPSVSPLGPQLASALFNRRTGFASVLSACSECPPLPRPCSAVTPFCPP